MAEEVPAGDVDAALDVGVALEGGVHAAVEDGGLARVEADEMRGELAQTSADALGIGGEVEGAERADFTVAGQAGVGLDADDGAVEDGDGFAAGPFVAAFAEGKLDAVGEDAGDFHWGSLAPSERCRRKGAK